MMSSLVELSLSRSMVLLVVISGLITRTARGVR